MKIQMRHDYDHTAFHVTTTFRHGREVVTIESGWHSSLPSALAMLGEACRNYAKDVFLRGDVFTVTLDEVHDTLLQVPDPPSPPPLPTRKPMSGDP